MKKICLFPRRLLAVVAVVVLLIAAAVPAVSAVEYTGNIDYDEHIINIYDESPPLARSFANPSPTKSHINLHENDGSNGLNQFIIHRDIGDLDHIYFSSSKIVPQGYVVSDRVSADFYYVNRTSGTSFLYSFDLSEGEYVGSGSLYMYSNSETQEGHLTIDFDTWDSSLYADLPNIEVAILIDAERPLKFNTMAFGNAAAPLSYYNPIDNKRVCTVDGTVGDRRDVRYGETTTVYTKSGEFQNKITYHKDSAGVVYIAIDRHIEERLNPSHITVTSTSQGYTYLTDDTVSETVLTQLPLSEAPFKIDIYSPLIDKTYTCMLYGDGEPEAPADAATVNIRVQDSQTTALLANAHIIISASVDNEFYEVINRTLPNGTYTGDLQPTGGGRPNPDFYRLITTVEGYNSEMPYIDFDVDKKTTIYAYLNPIGGAPENENKTFIDFYVRDSDANGISGATVKFGKYTLITNSAGYVMFEVDKNKNYSWTVSKSGYGSLTGTAVIGDAPRHTINTGIDPAVTPTKPTPISTSTPISPTPTMTAPTGESVSNWLEWFAAHFGMILGGGVEIGKIFMWLCFTVPVGVYVGKEAKAGAAGFMAGAGIVTLFFVLIGWVPIWLLVLLALIIGLLYAKEFNTSDNGGGR